MKTRNRKRRNMHNWVDRLEPRMLLSSASFQLPAPPSWPNQNAGAFFLTAGPRQSLWISDGALARIIKVSLSGAMTQYQVPNGGEAAMMSAGPDGILWFYDDIDNSFGTLTPNGKVHEYAVPDFGSEQMIVDSMSEGPGKLLWFSGGNDATVMGTMSRRGVVREWAIKVPNSYFGEDLTLASDGTLWSDAGLTDRGPDSFVLYTANGGRRLLRSQQNNLAALVAGAKGSMWSIDGGSFTDASTIFHYFRDGHTESYNIQVDTFNILPARDGGAWFLYGTQGDLNFQGLGKVTPSGEVYDIAVPVEQSFMATGPDGKLWGPSGFPGAGPSEATRFDPKTAVSLHPRLNITVQSGAPRTYKLAIISNFPRKATPSEFIATVNWGDGTTGTAMVTRRGNHFVVSADHNYAAGNWNATLIVNFAGATVESGSAIDALLPPSSGSG